MFAELFGEPIEDRNLARGHLKPILERDHVAVKSQAPDSTTRATL